MSSYHRHESFGTGHEEEKNDSSPSQKCIGTGFHQLLLEQENLPTELDSSKVYENECELWEDLETYDLTDLQIVRNDERYAVWREMPGPIHNAAVIVIQVEFYFWKREQAAVLFGEKATDVFVDQSYERNMKRCPDFAFWDPDRLIERELPCGNAEKKR
jgi:hypothetical protein